MTGRTEFLADPIQDRLVGIFSDLMIRETVPVERRTKLNCIGWDSLMQLNLVLAIEQEFGVTLTDDEAVELNSFQAALEMIREKRAQGAQAL